MIEIGNTINFSDKFFFFIFITIPLLRRGSYLKSAINDIKYNTNSDYAEENGFGPSSLHHFHHKLFKLGDHMNTKTGTKLAKQRIKFMKKFEKQLIAEIEGIC